MIFSINKNYFIDELSRSNRVVDPKANIPSITGVLLDVNTSFISLVSTNNSIAIKSVTEVGESGLEIKEVGTILLKGRMLLETLRKMDDEIVTISSVEKNLIRVSGEKTEFNLNVLDHEDFPLVGFREKGDTVDVANINLKKAMNQTIISVDEWNQKNALTGLNFKVVGNLLYIAGTDGFRVSRKIIDLEQIFDTKIESNIPYKSILEISKILPDKGECKVIFTDGYVSFVFKNVVFQTTILEGSFPDVNAVFPTDFNTTIYVENKIFSKVISRADIPSEENSSTVVNLILQGDLIYIKSNIQQIGSFEEQFKDFELRGIDEQNICFNSKFFMESLRSFETKTIEINLIDSKKPIVLTSEEDKNLSQIILPMFTNS